MVKKSGFAKQARKIAKPLGRKAIRGISKPIKNPIPRNSFGPQFTPMQRAVVRALMDAIAHAKRICPVDTGRLRNSIEGAIEGNTVILRSRIEYASFVEYGTGRMDSQPYLGPAMHAFVMRYLPNRIKQEYAKQRRR